MHKAVMFVRAVSGIIPGQDCWIYDAAEDTTFHQTEAFYGHHGFRLDAFTPPYTVSERCTRLSLSQSDSPSVCPSAGESLDRGLFLRADSRISSVT